MGIGSAVVVITVHFAGRSYFRQYAAGYIEQAQQLIVPLSGMYIEQERARGIGNIGHMQFAAREFPGEPGIDGTESQPAFIGGGPGAGHGIQYPFQLGAAEISIDYQACLLPYKRAHALRPQFIAPGGGTAILPYNGIIHRLARFAIPHDGSFALVGNADGGYLPGRYFAGPITSAITLNCVGPYFFRIVLTQPACGYSWVNSFCASNSRYYHRDRR